MTRPTILLTAFTFMLWFGQPALAQHGSGFGGGFGRGSLGIGNVPGGAHVGHSGADTGLPANQRSQGELTKGNIGATGSKTTTDLLSQNSKLSSNLQGLLPTGTNLQDAAKGFDHLGQFVAAVHVSHNLGIPFDQLKSEMMNGNSLGEAIHKLRPNVDARHEAIRANQQALDDMEKSATSHNVADAVR